MRLIRTAAVATLLFASLTTVSARNRDMGSMEMDDGMYVEQMMQHHEQAIKMAEMAVDKADTEIVKQVATRTVADQRKDMEELRVMQRELKSADKESDSEQAKQQQAKQQMSASSEQAMNKLQSTSKAQFDTAFLQAMTQHHQQGIQMTRSNLTRFKNPEVKQFANMLLKKQTLEQKEMQKLSKDVGKGKYSG